MLIEEGARGQGVKLLNLCIELTFTKYTQEGRSKLKNKIHKSFIVSHILGLKYHRTK